VQPPDEAPAESRCRDERRGAILRPDERDAGLGDERAPPPNVEAVGRLNPQPGCRAQEAQQRPAVAAGKRALEVGARIVVVPMVNTAEQARAIVEYGKFPPLGLRGFNVRSRGVEYGLSDRKTAFANANARTHLFAQIESMEAVANVEAICRVEGLSGILIGPGDLSVSAGCSDDLNGPQMIEIVTQTLRCARSLEKHAGILISPGPLLDAALAAGCDLVFCGGDVTELSAAWPRLLGSVGAKSASR